MKLDNGQAKDHSDNPLVFGEKESKELDLLMSILFKIYQIGGALMFVLGAAGFVLCILFDCFTGGRGMRRC